MESGPVHAISRPAANGSAALSLVVTWLMAGCAPLTRSSTMSAGDVICGAVQTFLATVPELRPKPPWGLDHLSGRRLPPGPVSAARPQGMGRSAYTSAAATAPPRA